MTPDEDPVSFAPDATGPHGRAWLMDVPQFLRNSGKDPALDCTVVSWLVEAPWAHPVWHSYALMCIHLRPTPNGAETIFHLEGATHEMWLYALNMESPRDAILRGETLPFLLPINFASQFVCKNDSEAARRIEEALRGILAGKLSPDTDFIGQWVQLFGNNMIRK